MRHLLLRCLLLLARLIRLLLDYVSEKVFSFLASGKKETLPPIRDNCLLETAVSLATKIRKQEIKSTDVVKAYIQRIKEIQPIVNAVVDDRFTEALEEARQADELIQSGVKSEEELAAERPFLGVPISVKEAIGVKGCLFTVGLPARKGVRATSDAEVVALMKRAGAIPVAVTITPELCFWWESYNKLYGRSRNPYDTTRTVGGSSGGEGCIIGSAGSVIGLANDIGGSIRIPAFFNGVFGHKPSRGVVSNVGEYPPAAPALQTFLMTGPMCRYAKDLLPMMKILASNKKEKMKLDEPVDISKVKIFYMENDGGNPLISSVDPEITKAQRRVLQYFKSTYSTRAEKVSIPNMFHSFEIWANVIRTSGMKPITVEMTGRMGNANLAVEWLRWILGISDHILPLLCSAALNRLLSAGDEKRSVKYYRMMSELQQQFEVLLDEASVFLYPTGPDTALYHNQPLTKPFSVGYTGIFNLLGLPISQCPLGLSSKGLPLGIQVVGALNNDRLTLAVAEELEKAFGGWVSPSAVVNSSQDS